MRKGRGNRIFNLGVALVAVFLLGMTTTTAYAYGCGGSWGAGWGGYSYYPYCDYSYISYPYSSHLYSDSHPYFDFGYGHGGYYDHGSGEQYGGYHGYRGFSHHGGNGWHH